MKNERSVRNSTGRLEAKKARAGRNSSDGGGGGVSDARREARQSMEHSVQLNAVPKKRRTDADKEIKRLEGELGAKPTL